MIPLAVYKDEYAKEKVNWKQFQTNWDLNNNFIFLDGCCVKKKFANTTCKGVYHMEAPLGNYPASFQMLPSFPVSASFSLAFSASVWTLRPGSWPCSVISKQ